MKRWGVVLLVLVVVLGVGALGFQNYRAPVQVPVTPMPTPPTRVRVPGVVSAAALIAPATHASLAFPIGGRIANIRVKEGDSVKAGAVLAQLDTFTLELQVAQAQTALDIARQQLVQTEQGGTDAERAAAQAALTAAQENYDRVKVGPTAHDLAALKATVDNAKAALDQAQAAYDRIGGDSNPNGAMSQQRRDLQQAYNSYNAALAAYQAAQEHPTAAELATAFSQIKAAEEQLARLTPAPSALALAEAQVKQAQVALSLAQANLANATLVAPFDGTVVQITPNIGEVVVSGAPVMVLGDLAHLQAQTTDLADTDVSRVRPGQAVTVTLDAFPEQTFEGHVVAIAPLANDSRGQEVFTVKVDLPEGAASGLRWGMTAQVEIAASGQ